MTQIASLPKVVLHDHLDGGLRPSTVLALADETGYLGLPRHDERTLAEWFDQSHSASLVGYLAAFDQTVAVMQTPAALQRVARETVEDHAADGVVYAEIRFAPSLHLRQGMTRSEVIGSVLRGLAEGEEATGVVARVIIDAMRHEQDAVEVAAAAVEFAGRGVVGFDLAGPEVGFPASAHRRALAVARNGGLRLTIHAGEADGPAGIADALDSGAERLGHGVRIVEDAVVREGQIVDLGPIARRVHRDAIPLEICLSSNIHTGAVPAGTRHPAGMLLRAGFNVTLNTDNRLMSRTSMSREFAFARSDLGFSDDDLRTVTDHAVLAAFCDEPSRRSVVAAVAARYESI
ncbi:MAG: adenosine deaminase [Actinobacteria bacterium]|nr:adenosine deaminase [Actinomycetota bacterium]MBU1493919.1 adenosine deaminase [Actinomycetota bacterium]MBU1866485.1 adenosine deaminase [Actinomycetota bacterium]